MESLIGSHGDAIAAIIGAVYVIARVVVTLTPTKDDDKVFKGISGKVFMIAKVVFGLDPKQGLKKHSPK